MKGFLFIYIPECNPALKRLTWLALILLFWPLSAPFSKENLDLEHLTIRAFTAPEELPNEVVRDVIMTKDGSVWIATWGGGIVVMNGTAKRLINKQNGLISDDVRVLEEDLEGRVWVGTSTGISCIQNLEIINFSTASYPGINVTDSIFSIESIHNGEVWFGDGIGNLFAWVPSNDSHAVQNGSWKLVYNFRNYLYDKNNEECSIRKIEQYKDGSIWLAINPVGVVKINSPGNFSVTVVRTDPYSSYCFDFFIVDAIQQFFINYRGLGEIVQCKGESGYCVPAFCKCIGSAFGALLVGTEQGLYYWYGDQFLPLPLTWNTRDLFSPDSQFHPIPLTKNNRLYYIESISSLRDGSLWVGTRNGAFRITKTSWIPQNFSSQSTMLFNENYAPGFKQKALALDGGGHLWAYRDHVWKTIHQFDQTFALNPDKEFIPLNTLYARSNQLLIQNATESIEFDLSQMKIVNRFLFINDFNFGGKYQTFITDQQEIWYTGLKGVLKRKDYDFIPVFELSPDISHEVFSILQTGPDKYWIGGKGWLGCYQGGKFETVELPPLLKDNKAPFIRSLQTEKGELWFSQLGQGILCFNGSQWYQNNQKNGLPSNYIMSLKQSRDGTIWAGDRNNGVMSFKDRRWIKYDDEDGISLGPVTTITEDEDGHILIGQIKQYLKSSIYYVGVMEYRPDSNPPAVQILSASKRLLPDAPGIFSFQGHDAWNETPREQLVYSWRVLKKNGKVIHDWCPYSSDNSALTPTLSPGDYIFEVRTQDRHRNTSSSAAAAFVVEPYFWMNRYFQIPFALAVFFAAMSLYMNRKQYKQKMENRLLQEKMAADQLVLKTHDEQQKKFGQDLHDTVVQDLTGILNLVQILIDKRKKTSMIDSHDIELLVQVVEKSCMKTRKMSMGFSPVDFKEIDLTTALKEICYDLEKAFPGPVYHCEILSEIPCLDEKTQYNLYCIISEALHNAAKHSANTSLILLKVEIIHNQLIFTVKDDGNRSEEKSKSRGLGRGIMHHRSRFIGAILKISLPPEGGTVVECQYSLPE